MEMLIALIALAIAIASSLLPGGVSAEDLCEAKVLRDVAAIESPEYMLSRGESLTGVSQYRVNKMSGVTSFCSHGGYCYPTHVVVKGKKVKALRLTNCKIGRLDSSPYSIPAMEAEDIYSIEVVRAKNSPEALRRDDLENKLLNMRLCSACAGNAAEFYLSKPNSKCAKLVKQALEGNPVAESTLQDFPDYCWYWK